MRNMRRYFDNPGGSFLVSDTETNSCLYFSYDDFHDEFYYHVKDMHVNNEMQELNDPTNSIKLLTQKKNHEIRTPIYFTTIKQH